LLDALRHQRGLRRRLVVGADVGGEPQVLGQAVELGLRHAQQLEQALETAQADSRDRAGLDQVGQVQQTLLVRDLARQEHVVGVAGRVGRAAIGGQEGRQARFLQRHRPGLGQVVGAAAAGVLAQDQARPVLRAGEHPGGLHAAALGRLHLHAAPLLPQRPAASVATSVTVSMAASSAAPAWRARHDDLPPPTVGRTQSRVSSPVIAWPGGSVRTMRTPSGTVTVRAPVTVPVATGEAGLAAACVRRWTADWSRRRAEVEHLPVLQPGDRDLAGPAAGGVVLRPGVGAPPGVVDLAAGGERRRLPAHPAWRPPSTRRLQATTRTPSAG
jgi:hypothetical protein